MNKPLTKSTLSFSTLESLIHEELVYTSIKTGNKLQCKGVVHLKRLAKQPPPHWSRPEHVLL